MISLSAPVKRNFGRRMAVTVGGMVVCNHPDVTIATGLIGSGLAITFYDPATRVGGLLHAILPHSGMDPARAAKQPAIFVDSGLAALIQAAGELKGQAHRAQVCVTGGSRFVKNCDFLDVSERNRATLVELLGRHEIKILAEEVGGHLVRAVELDLATGDVLLSHSGSQEKTILHKA